MEQRQPVALQLGGYMTRIALVVSAAGLVRTFFQLLSSQRRGQGVESRPSTEDEATVSVGDRGNGMGILAAGVVGAAIGAGAALLCAPRSGRESREWIAEQARGAKDRAGVVFGQNDHPPRIHPMSR